MRCCAMKCEPCLKKGDFLVAEAYSRVTGKMPPNEIMSELLNFEGCSWYKECVEKNTSYLHIGNIPISTVKETDMTHAAAQQVQQQSNKHQERVSVPVFTLEQLKALEALLPVVEVSPPPAFTEDQQKFLSALIASRIPAAPAIAPAAGVPAAPAIAPAAVVPAAPAPATTVVVQAAPPAAELGLWDKAKAYTSDPNNHKWVYGVGGLVVGVILMGIYYKYFRNSEGNVVAIAQPHLPPLGSYE